MQSASGSPSKDGCLEIGEAQQFESVCDVASDSPNIDCLDPGTDGEKMKLLQPRCSSASVG